jgi:hypothetical protein
MQSVGPTRVPVGGGVISRNVEMWPAGAIAKRPGYQRFNVLDMASPVTCFLEIEGKVVSVALGGPVDAR